MQQFRSPLNFTQLRDSEMIGCSVYARPGLVVKSLLMNWKPASLVVLAINQLNRKVFIWSFEGTFFRLFSSANFSKIWPLSKHTSVAKVHSKWNSVTRLRHQFDVHILHLKLVHFFNKRFFALFVRRKCPLFRLFFLIKWAIPGLFFVYFHPIKQTFLIFTTIKCETMSIQYTVLGFEPTTFSTWVSSDNHNTRAPALFRLLLRPF